MNVGPVNLGLVQRSLREIVWTTITLALFLGSISALLAYALPRIQARFMQRSFIPPGVRQFRDAIFGFDSTQAGVAEIAFSLAWSHPIVIALLSAHAIIVCTRILAAEVERGTVDVLLALPVSRLRLLTSETLAWLLSAGVLLGAVLGGSYLGSRFIPQEHRPDFGKLLMVLVNLALVYGVIGTSSILMGVLTDRRVRAVLTVLVLTVFSVLISFLHTLDPSLEFTKNLRFLSVLDYYKPIRVLMDGAWPWRDLAILGGVCLGLWSAAAVVLARRDVTTT
jgi:ABC-type transport system involved in multi-copper enzyme maturation permease subunit